MGNKMAEIKNLMEMLQNLKENKEHGITFVGSEDAFYSYRDIFHHSLCLLQRMQESGIKKGDEVSRPITIDNCPPPS